MDLPITLLMEYSPQGLILIMLWVSMQFMKTVNEIKGTTDQLIGIVKKERFQTQQFRSKMLDEIADSKSQHVKIETLLEILHSESKK